MWLLKILAPYLLIALLVGGAAGYVHHKIAATQKLKDDKVLVKVQTDLKTAIKQLNADASEFKALAKTMLDNKVALDAAHAGAAAKHKRLDAEDVAADKTAAGWRVRYQLLLKSKPRWAVQMTSPACYVPSLDY